MSRPPQKLRSDASQILALLDQGFPFSLGPEERRAILTETGSVLHRLEAIEQEVLSIGILGGTGVGKSTLMNALAGERIASASHRRPHTDRVLVYRHENAGTLPFLEKSTVGWKEITHGVDSVRHIALCDMPDFDSMEAANAAGVLRFLEHLDVLVWLTSLEKYGDARFYEFLKGAPKAARNFVFVLNKLDLLFQENEQEGYERLGRTLAVFRSHLLENGIQEPLLYALAAEQALEPKRTAPWNQFSLFRQYIFQQRDSKEVGEIRSANLDAELRGISSVLERESVHLTAAEQFLESSFQNVESRKAAWMKNADEAVSGWLGKEWTARLLQRMETSALVGPGLVMDMALREWQRGRNTDRPNSESPSHVPPGEVVGLFTSQVEELRDGIMRQMLVHGLPRAWLDRTESVLNVSGRVEMFEKSLNPSLFPEEFICTGFWGFRMLQYTAYAVLFFLFLVAIGGREAWEGILMHPSLRTALGLVVSWINTLFSAQGLAALGSYVLLSLYLGYRFFRRYKKLVKGAAEKKAMQNREALVQVWDRQIQSLMEDLTVFRSDIRSKIAFLDALVQKHA